MALLHRGRLNKCSHRILDLNTTSEIIEANILILCVKNLRAERSFDLLNLIAGW